MSGIERQLSVRGRLKYLMEIHEVDTSPAFAALTGVSEKTIRGILRRDAIGPKSARQIAEKLNIAYKWLKTGEGPVERAVSARRPPSVTTPDGPNIVVSADPFVLQEGALAHKSERTSVRERLLIIQEVYEIATLSGLAHAAGIEPQTLIAIVEADSISEPEARRMAVSLHVSFDWLMYGNGPMELKGSEIKGQIGFSAEETAGQFEPQPAEQAEIPASDDFCLIQKAESPLSLGGGTFPEERMVAERYAFRRSWLTSVATSPRNVLLFDVKGDSMFPTLWDKDTVLIDRGRTRILGDRIYAIAVGGVIQLKRLQLMAGGRVRVISDNAAYHTYECSVDDLRIIGQMVWSGRTWG